jgi:hypothetical protein
MPNEGIATAISNSQPTRGLLEANEAAKLKVNALKIE